LKRKIHIGLWITIAVVLFTGCADPGLGAIENEVVSALENGHASGTEVDFAKIVSAPWDKIVIVCSGATDGNLAEYKLAVEASADLESPSFLALMLFLDGSKVAAELNVGQNINFTTNFTPCLREDPAFLTELPRVDSKMSFVLDSDSQYWYRLPS